MKRVALATALIFVTTVAAGADFIKAVKETKASAIEAALPKIKFEDWIRENFKFGNSVSWQINDCGEGSDTRNPRAPTCVEARIPGAKDYTLHISTIIGVTTELQVTKPILWIVYFYKGNGRKDMDVVRLSSISEALVEYNLRNDE